MSYKAGNLVVDILANDKVSATLDKIENKIGKFGKTSNRKTKDGGSFGFLNIAKWTAVFVVARRLGKIVGTIAQSGADYTETLNLWETSMGSNLSLATDFVSKMNEAYGISEKTLMNAQAIFKNMLGSLGQISDTMAYSLSEGITQMALDYASLYNVTFEKAFEKFQSALAGQVRPIRSVSGYDITETTIYQLYQKLGGTKTMRQLTRTEKQLLSIYAVFQQMERSGAVGDLDKTMESFANQSRVMAESWQQVMTYAGLLLTHLIEQSGLMVNINAVLIFLGDTLKAVAESMGAVKSFGGDIFEATTDSALAASDAIDEVKGKLLDFDKFRSLSGSEESNLGLDEKLAQALTSYDAILGNASMKARNLAENLKIASGLFDEDGIFNVEKWEDVIDQIETFGNAILVAFVGTATYKAITGFTTIIGGATTALKTFKESMALISLSKEFGLSLSATAEGVGGISKASLVLSKVLTFLTSPLGIILIISGLLYATNEDFRELINSLFTLLGGFLNQILNPIIGSLGGLFNILSGGLDVIGDTATILVYLAMNILKPVLYFIELIIKSVSTVLEVLNALFNWNWTGLGSKLNNLWSNWSTSEFASLVSMPSIYSKFAEGGMPDKGTMFVAGEAGAEIVYNTPNGQSGVVNVQQIEQAMYGALVRYGKTQGSNGQPIELYLDGEKVYQNTTAHAKRRGKGWSNI